MSPAINLTAHQKRYLRGLAHSLKPVVMIGASGLTENVIAEIDASIEHHELIKVRVNATDREERVITAPTRALIGIP